MRTPRLALRLAALLLLASPPVVAQQIVGTRDARALRTDSVFQRFDRTDSPGCAVGVYQDGQILYARGYGMASLEHGVATLAALGARRRLDLQAVHRDERSSCSQKDGKLSIDDPIRKYIPEMPRVRGQDHAAPSRSARRAGCATSTA